MLKILNDNILMITDKAGIIIDFLPEETHCYDIVEIINTFRSIIGRNQRAIFKSVDFNNDHHQNSSDFKEILHVCTSIIFLVAKIFNSFILHS